MSLKSRRERGSALLTTLVMVAVILMLVAAILAYSQQVRIRSIRTVRKLQRSGCAEAGLQLARSYFQANVLNWPTYLAAPDIYDPVAGTWMAALSAPHNHAADPTSSTLQATHPELFADLDADGKPDVFIYIRDNQDEFPPAKNDFTRDNDQNVIVGAVCISSTLAPRRDDGQVDPSQLSVEGLFSYNVKGTTYRAQSAQGASGDGNLNNN